MCTQYLNIGPRGEEDCLYLNVYTPVVSILRTKIILTILTAEMVYRTNILGCSKIYQVVLYLSFDKTYCTIYYTIYSLYSIFVLLITLLPETLVHIVSSTIWETLRRTALQYFTNIVVTSSRLEKDTLHNRSKIQCTKVSHSFYAVGLHQHHDIEARDGLDTQQCLHNRKQREEFTGTWLVHRGRYSHGRHELPSWSFRYYIKCLDTMKLVFDHTIGHLRIKRKETQFHIQKSYSSK